MNERKYSSISYETRMYCIIKNEKEQQIRNTARKKRLPFGNLSYYLFSKLKIILS